MNYNKIVAVSGMSGLYELVSSKADGGIVRSLEDNSSKFVSNRVHNFSHLESIEIYTATDNVNLVDVFLAMKESKEALPDGKADAKAIKAYFEKVYPDMDFERVYGSDMKKMIKWVQILDKSGVEIKYFNTVSSLQVMSAQYRNHRKVIIIDGKEVITGGRNIGDEYFDLHEKYSFLDRDIVVTGELVSTIAKTFDAMFNSQLSVHVDRDYLPYPSDPKYRRGDQENYRGYDIDIKNWNKNVADAKSFLETPVDSKLLTEIRKKGQIELNGVYKGICNEITFRTEQPELGEINRKSNRILKFDVFNRIRFAKESIVMESPYFIINDELGRYLSDALLRNIKVKALTNSLNSSDAPYVYAAFDTIIPKWLKRGLDAYIFIGSKPASYSVLEDQSGAARFGVHAKTMIFDHSDVMIGTYNVDPRSANYNSEMSITCDNNVELADVVQKDIDSRIESSIRLDTRQKIKEAEFQQISFGKRIIYYLSKGISYGFGFLL